VLDADEVAHDVMRPGTAVARAVARAFGTDMMGPDGAPDRTRLAARVFADPAARARLNALVHPAVLRRCRAWRAAQRRVRKPSLTIVPLLFEVGETADWDAVGCIAARRDTILRRLRARGLNARDAAARLRAQWPVRKKSAAADWTIWNDGTRRAFARAVARQAAAYETGTHGTIGKFDGAKE